MKGKRILSAVLAASTLWMSVVPAELTAFALNTPVKFPSGITLGTSSTLGSSSETGEKTLRLCFRDYHSQTLTFDEGGQYKQFDNYNFDTKNYPLASSIYAMTGEYPCLDSIKVDDIELTYSWSFVTESEENPNININNWLGGFKDGSYDWIQVDTQNTGVTHNKKSGSYTLKASDIDSKHTVSNYANFGFNGGVSSFLAGDSFTINTTDIVLEVSYKESDNYTFVSADELEGCPYINVTSRISPKTECGHENHVGDDGKDWSEEWTYCPWAYVDIYGVLSNDTITDNKYTFYYSCDKSKADNLLKYSDIINAFGTEDINGLILVPGSCAVDKVECLKTLPDVQLGNLIIGETPIEEIIDNNKKTGTAEIIYDGLIAQNGNPKQFNGYKALKIDYTLQNAKDTSAIVVVLHGWGSTPNVDWTDLYFKPEANNGSVVIDLSDYYDLDYNNIRVGVAAQPDAKIGEIFAPEFAVTDAKLLTEYDGEFSTAIDPVTALPPLPEFKATAGNKSISLNWNSVFNAEKYRIKYVTGTTEKSVETDKTSYTIQGLTNDTPYDVIVLAVNAKGKQESAYTDKDFVQVTPFDPYPALPSFKVAAGEEKATISWNTVKGATKYRVYYRVNGTTKWTIKEVTTTTHTIGGLTGGTKYDFLVLAYNDTYWSKWTTSDIISATPTIAPPALPTLKVTAGNAKADLSWNAVTGASKYRVYYKVNGTTKWTTKDVTTTSCTISGLTNGTKYDFLVLAYNGKWSKWTNANIKNATPVIPVPALPTLKVTAGNAKADLSWNKVTGASKYRVYYKVNGTTKWTTKDVTTTSYTISGLTNGTKYDFLVLAYNGKWSSWKTTNIVNATPAIPVPALPTLKVTAANTGASLSWNAVTGATKYRVYYRKNGTTSWTTKDVTKTSYNVSGLTNNTKYDFLVLAYNGKWSKWTNANIVKATPSASAAPLTPAIKAAIGNGQTVLSWKSVNGAVKYRVYYKLSGTTKWTYKDVTTTSYTVSGLTNGKKYDFLVLAGSAKAWSKWTNADIVNATPISALALPTVKATAGNAKVALSWNAVTGASKYRVYYRVSGTTKWTYKDVTSRSYTISGLKNGTKYDILVLTGSTNSFSKWTTANIINATPKA